MFIFISDVLDGEAVSSLREAAERLNFEDGMKSAGWHAHKVKRNRQAVPGAPLRQVQARITAALDANDVFQAAALPRRIAPPLLARYGPEEAYGPHVDNAVLGNPPLRSDLSLTLFLSDPESYEGGELIVETPAGEEAVKLDAGAAVLYPSTTLHRVAPIRSGERLAAVTWIESLVRSGEDRAILFDLDRAKRQLFKSGGKSEIFDLVAKAHTNLLRRLAET